MRLPPVLAMAALVGSVALFHCSSDDPKRECHSAVDCRGAELCVGGFCTASTAQDGGDLGAVCAADDDCNSGLACIPGSLGFTGGTCVQPCSAATCPGATVCADLRNTPAGSVACLRS